jgi:hypothetical protein
MLLNRAADSHSLARMRLSMRPYDLKQDFLDQYVTVELTKTQCRIRSFAMGGLPYFESSHSMSDPASKTLVENIVSGRLDPAIRELFDGIDIEQLSELPCFVTDRRHAIAVEVSVTLAAEKAEPTFKVSHAYSRSQNLSVTDLYE